MTVTGSVDVHGQPKRVLMLASNPAVSPVTGWSVGFWWAELTHPYWEFIEHGYEVVIASPGGGALVGDAYSDPRDPLRLLGRRPDQPRFHQLAHPPPAHRGHPRA